MKTILALIFFILQATLAVAQEATSVAPSSPQTTSLQAIEDAKNANQQNIDNMLQQAESAIPSTPDPNLLGEDSDEAYIYDPTNKRDPFVPYTPVVITDGPKIKQPTGPVEPLQLYDVAELKVVGIIIGGNRSRAMVKDPTEKVHPVVLLQKIGKNNGYVELIKEGEIIVVEEAVQDGKLTKIVRTLPIKK